MTRDTKMLLTIVAGATLAGWLVVRLVSPGLETAVPEAPIAEEPLAAAPKPAPVAEPAAEPSKEPGETEEPAEDQSEAIVRDLQVLVRAVRQDKHVQNRAFPESTRILDLPSLIQYVRAVEFWQPAFPKTGTKGDR